jgi:hypothetical protein
VDFFLDSWCFLDFRLLGRHWEQDLVVLDLLLNMGYDEDIIHNAYLTLFNATLSTLFT